MSDQYPWRRTLDWLQERNDSIEITRGTDDEHNPLGPVYRVRLIRFDDRGLIVETPRVRGGGRSLRTGMTVTVWVTRRHERWELLAKIQGERSFPLNERTNINVFEISLPTEVRDVQQRESFRVVIHDDDLSAITIAPDLSQPPQAIVPSRVDITKPVTAQVNNIGNGGIGVEVSSDAGLVMNAFRSCKCTLQWPGSQGRQTIKAEVVHHETVDRDISYFGLSFRFDGGAAGRRQQDSISRLLAYIERQQLQARRGLRSAATASGR